MARITITDNSFRNVIVKIEELQYNVCDYERISIYFKDASGSINLYSYSYTPKSTDEYDYISVKFNTGYTGYSFFSPSCTYYACADATINGATWSIPSQQFKTTSVNEPTFVGDIEPVVFPNIKDQGNASNCAAHAITTMMEIMSFKQTGKLSGFSSYYFWGACSLNYDGSIPQSQIDYVARDIGAPKWQISSGLWPETGLTYGAAQEIYRNSDTTVKEHAKQQCFDGYVEADFYNPDSVAAYIRTYGCFWFAIRSTNVLKCNNRYILLPPENTSASGMAHVFVLIGSTTIDGEKHWIAQNSWGTGWGNGGRCYIPYDWGSGFSATNNDGSALTWVFPSRAYTKYQIEYVDPPAPDIISISQDIPGDASAYAHWTPSATGGGIGETTYFVLSRKYESTRWYTKAITTGTDANLEFDGLGTYEIAIAAIYDDHCSDPSSIYTLVLKEKSDKTRPENWSWSNITSGANIPFKDGAFRPVTATEWNSFCDRINEFLDYLDMQQYPFTTVFIGNDFTSKIYDEAVAAIKRTGYGSAVKTASERNKTISAELFTSLSSAINKIQ